LSDHIVATDVIARIDQPVVVTVAGSAAQSAPATIAGELGDKVDLVLDAGPTPYNKPSTILHVRPDRYELVRAGVYDERIIERLLRTTILFVCSGNTCRSPMAESIARITLARKLNVPPDELEKKGISIISAGSFAMPGARATPQAVEAVKDLGRRPDAPPFATTQRRADPSGRRDLYDEPGARAVGHGAGPVRGRENHDPRPRRRHRRPDRRRTLALPTTRSHLAATHRETIAGESVDVNNEAVSGQRSAVSPQRSARRMHG
jgi:hypothetical protein